MGGISRHTNLPDLGTTHIRSTALKPTVIQFFEKIESLNILLKYSIFLKSQTSFLTDEARIFSNIFAASRLSETNSRSNKHPIGIPLQCSIYWNWNTSHVRWVSVARDIGLHFPDEFHHSNLVDVVRSPFARQLWLLLAKKSHNSWSFFFKKNT